MSPERLGPPPVDPLSDVGWARVERNLFSRVEGTVTNAVAAREVKPSSSRNNWVWLAVPAAAAAAFALAFFSMTPSSPSTSEGERSRIVAGAAPSTVSFANAYVTLDANAAVIMDHDRTNPTAVLEDGSAKFAVAQRATPLTVLAGDMTARTVNATFTVTRHGELADVAVTAGSVEIRFRGHDVKLTTNQSWSSEHPSDVANP